MILGSGILGRGNSLAPPAPTLSVSDNADGSGGTWTVTGSPSGARNDVWYGQWTGRTGAISWTPGGHRTGDGTSNTLNVQGFFVWLCYSTLGGVTSLPSNLVYQNLSNAGVDQPPKRILDAALNKLIGLNLPGLASANVVQKWLPRFISEVDAYPTVMVCPATDPENYPGILNSKDDIGVPILIAILDRQDKLSPNEWTANLARNLNWRWQIISAFRYQPSASFGVPEVIQTFPEKTIQFDEKMFDIGVFFSPIIIRFLTRTTRG